MMHELSRDRRSERTRRWIREAFLVLVEERGFEAVTVQDIVARAQINRTTFYRHYQDKYELAQHYLHDIFDSFIQTLPDPEDSQEFYQAALDEPPVGVVHLLEHIATHARFYRIMLGKSGKGEFAEYMRSYFAQVIRGRINHFMPDKAQERVPREVIVQFYASACLGIATWWLEEQLPYTPRQLATWAVELLLYGPHVVLGLSGLVPADKRREI